MQGDFNKRDEVLIMLEKCQRKFRYAPRRQFLEEVATYLASKLRIKEIENYLEQLPLKKECFPTSLTEIEKETREIIFKKAPTQPYQSTIRREDTWVSKQAAGTPAQAEALFNMIKKGKSAELCFKIARRAAWAKGLTDDEIWICYQDWCQGKVNPLVIKYKDIFS